MPTKMSRRAVVVSAGCLLFASVAGAHTPYRQWEVYRRKHLLIGTCRADPGSYPMGKRLVAILASGLPESKARVTRAPDQRRLAGLLTTEQLELVLLSFGEAVALARGKAPFAEFGPYPVRLLFAVDGYVLVCGEQFPARHAWLVTGTLADQITVSDSLAEADGELALHEGSRAFLVGEPEPD